MEKFKADIFKNDKNMPPYAYSVMKEKNIYYVHFSPNLSPEDGVMFGGAVTYAVNLDTQTIVAGKIYK